VSTGIKDGWDKAQIILSPVGGLLTAVAVAMIGFQLNARQAEDTKAKFYADLMGKREEADTSLRKDMFNSAIKTFAEANPQTLDKEVLDLELLAYNFHESIDLGPLFKDVYRRVIEGDTSGQKRKKYEGRLEQLAKDVIARQLTSLEAEGKLDADVYFENSTPVTLEGEVKPDGLVVIDTSLPKLEQSTKNDQESESIAPQRDFKLTVISVDSVRKELRAQLEVRSPKQRDATAVDSVFTVGFCDLPMIDNIRLPDGYRCAIVLRSFEQAVARITLVYFPASHAALKDKPYYNEVMYELMGVKDSARVKKQ
jgi:hypothetical protein